VEVTAVLSSKEYVPPIFDINLEEYKKNTESLKIVCPWIFEQVFSKTNSESLETVQEESKKTSAIVINDLLNAKQPISLKTVAMVSLYNSLAKAGISSQDVDRLFARQNEDNSLWTFDIYCKDEVVDSCLNTLQITVPIEKIKEAQIEYENSFENENNTTLNSDITNEANEKMGNIKLEEEMSRDWTPEELYNVDKKLHFDRKENEDSEIFPNLSFLGEGALLNMRKLGMSDEEILVFESELTTIIANKEIGIPVANWMRPDINETLNLTATWFCGKLDKNFYYRETNDELFANTAQTFFLDKTNEAVER